MTFLNTLARGTAALALAGASLAAQAFTVTQNFDGDLASTASVYSFSFSISARSDVLIWTDSASTSFDPVLALFDRDSGALLAASDDVGNPYPQVNAAQSATDAGLRLTDLAAGRYRVAISETSNTLTFANWGAGAYSLGALDGVALAPAASQWSVNLSITEAAPVPEPTTTALLAAGLLTVLWLARRNRSV